MTVKAVTEAAGLSLSTSSLDHPQKRSFSSTIYPAYVRIRKQWLREWLMRIQVDKRPQCELESDRIKLVHI
jgi:hypothetical protein